MKKLEIEYVSIDSIKEYINNAKLHPQEQIEQIKISIQEFGMNDPIGVWHNEIVEGHGRYKACKELGILELPIIRLDDLSDEQRKAYCLAHNKLTMNSDFDLDVLSAELDSILDIDMSNFGFDLDLPDFDDGAEFFERGNRNDTSREEGNDEYNEFLEKFEPKKTTDDCYTPERIYNAVVDWVCKEYGKDKEQFVRPFYPGGDYQKFTYPEGCVVVDNPPFSILSEILKFYAENKIDFFLFGPTLTLFSSSSSSSCAICIGASVTYENGANVDTSFLTSLENNCRLRSAPELYKAVNEANKANLKEKKIELPKYTYCDYIITSTRCSQFSRYGIDFRVPLSESAHIRQLDAQKESGKTIYGSGYLISERLKAEKEKAEREKAEREKAEREKAERWELSNREMEIVKQLN